jgi:sodium/proline symporter
LALCWKETTKWGALAGMIVGSVTIYVVKNFISIEGEYFYELMPAFALAFIAIVLVSKVTAKPSTETLKKFDLA